MLPQADNTIKTSQYGIFLNLPFSTVEFKKTDISFEETYSLIDVKDGWFWLTFITENMDSYGPYFHTTRNQKTL